jgi:hypothetical protein
MRISLLCLLFTGLATAQTDRVGAAIEAARVAENEWRAQVLAWKKRRTQLSKEGRQAELPPAPRHPYSRLASEMRELALTHAGKPAAARAWAWLFSPSRNADPYADPSYGAAAQEALVNLALGYAASPLIPDLARDLARRRYLVDKVGIEAIEAFAKAIRHSLHPDETKGRTEFALARALHRLASKTKIDAERTRLLTRARTHFERVAKLRFPTYPELAQRYLEEIDTLRVGMPAIPTFGPGGDGRQVRLADLRGKVVLIDFWGFW